MIAGTTIVDAENATEPIEGEWTGSLEIAPGQEARTYVEVADSSHGDADLFGDFDHHWITPAPPAVPRRSRLIRGSHGGLFPAHRNELGACRAASPDGS